MGPRFFIALVSAFAVTAVLLGGAGYTATRLMVPAPRDMFRAVAFEFELANGWWCELDGSEYVCSPPEKAPRSAIAIIAMKERNKDDSLDAYENHLRKPQAIDRDNPESPKSLVRFVRREAIGKRDWVTALHSGSELANFDTYYLATVTSHLGILVTMSVHKDRTQVYIGQLNQMMRTLNVYQR